MEAGALCKETDTNGLPKPHSLSNIKVLGYDAACLGIRWDDGSHNARMRLTDLQTALCLGGGCPLDLLRSLPSLLDDALRVCWAADDLREHPLLLGLQGGLQKGLQGGLEKVGL